METKSIKLTENQFYNVMAETVAKTFADGFNGYDALIKEQYEHCVSLTTSNEEVTSDKEKFEKEWEDFYTELGCPKLSLSLISGHEIEDDIAYDNWSEAFIWYNEFFPINYKTDVYQNLEAFYDYLIEKGYIDEYFLGFYNKSNKYKNIIL